jgi:hypothetical protein
MVRHRCSLPRRNRTRSLRKIFVARRGAFLLGGPLRGLFGQPAGRPRSRERHRPLAPASLAGSLSFSCSGRRSAPRLWHLRRSCRTPKEEHRSRPAERLHARSRSSQAGRCDAPRLPVGSVIAGRGGCGRAVHEWQSGPGSSAGSPCMWCTTTERSAKPVLHGDGLFCERRRNESLAGSIRAGATHQRPPQGQYRADVPCRSLPNGRSRPAQPLRAIHHAPHGPHSRVAAGGYI